MDMIDPTNANAGLFLVIIATAIATILSGFILVACIARFGLKIKVSFSSFITSATLSLLFFIGVGALGPSESTSKLPIIQLFSIFLFIGTILINLLFLKLLKPKSIVDLALAEHNKSTPDCQEHYKSILRELQEIEKLKVEQNLNTSNKFKQFFKFSKKGNRDVKS